MCWEKKFKTLGKVGKVLIIVELGFMVLEELGYKILVELWFMLLV
jgi:hypothetical protein